MWCARIILLPHTMESTFCLRWGVVFDKRRDRKHVLKNVNLNMYSCCQLWNRATFRLTQFDILFETSVDISFDPMVSQFVGHESKIIFWWTFCTIFLKSDKISTFFSEIGQGQFLHFLGLCPLINPFLARTDVSHQNFWDRTTLFGKSRGKKGALKSRREKIKDVDPRIRTKAYQTT